MKKTNIYESCLRSSWPNHASIKIQRGTARPATHSLHEGEAHVFRRLPVPLPLVYEPVVDLLLVEACRFSKLRLFLFLQQDKYSLGTQLGLESSNESKGFGGITVG